MFIDDCNNDWSSVVVGMNVNLQKPMLDVGWCSHFCSADTTNYSYLACYRRWVFATWAHCGSSTWPTIQIIVTVQQTNIFRSKKRIVVNQKSNVQSIGFIRAKLLVMKEYKVWIVEPIRLRMCEFFMLFPADSHTSERDSDNPNQPANWFEFGFSFSLSRYILVPLYWMFMSDDCLSILLDNLISCDFFFAYISHLGFVLVLRCCTQLLLNDKTTFIHISDCCGCLRIDW